MVCVLGVTAGVWWCCFFFFNDTATTEIYTLSLHDALPISSLWRCSRRPVSRCRDRRRSRPRSPARDRKSTRLNSSHSQISYAVFCLKKKKQQHRLNTSLLSLDTVFLSLLAMPIPRVSFSPV